jgi:integrase
MSDEIVVKVNSYGPGRPLSLVYFDPVSGRKKAKSAGTTDWREAERLAGELEKELRAGRGASPNKITWREFRKRYEDEKGAAQAVKTRAAFKSAANHLERVLNPDRLAKLTSATLSRFQAKLRDEGMGEVTIGSTLRHLRAALSWGADVGLLLAVPKMSIPRAGGARSRAVVDEEFDRMLLAVPKVRPQDAPAWDFYLRGLHLGGLRLEESLALSWDEDDPFAIDLTGRRPAFRIAAAAQKARRDERLPMTEDFYHLIMQVPEAERTGKVFKLTGLNTGCAITGKRVCRIVAAIGKRAGVVVATVEKRKRIDAKLVATTAKKFATAHDLRRSFGTRWSRRVMPAVLRRLMRHADVSTTMKYYVTIDADAVADELWGRDWESGNTPAAGNTFGNNRPQQAKEAVGDNGAAAPETPNGQALTSGGHGARTRNPITGAPHFQCGR